MLREDPSGLTANVGAVEVRLSGTQRLTTTYYFVGGQRIAMREDGEVTYLHGDHLGSASLATNASGARVSDMRYTPFGDVRYGDAPTDRRFTGQREEAGIGLYDFNARFYSSGLGRFISADSIVPGAGNSQALNRYAYVLNSPLKFSDPSGHDPIPGAYIYETGQFRERSNSIRWLVSFEGEWSVDYKGFVNRGARAVARRLHSIIRADIAFTSEIANITGRTPEELSSLSHLWGASQERIFREVFGDITFSHSDANCANCWAETWVPTIIIYDNAFDSARYLEWGEINTVHELGHAFSQRTGRSPYTKLAKTRGNHNDFPWRPNNPSQNAGGFASTYLGWQQSTVATSNEVFADMFVGYTYNTWADNASGATFANWMSNNMPHFVALAVTVD